MTPVITETGNKVTPKTNQQSHKVGLWSRLDYGSSGFRRGIIDSVFEIFRREQTGFNILVGGLVSEKDILIRIKEYVANNLMKDRKAKRKFARFSELLPTERTKARKKELAERCMRHIAKELSLLIPVLKGSDPEDITKEKITDLFITTSPAFDGKTGEAIAQLLTELRPDIRLWNEGGDRFLIKYVNKILWALAPEKAVWMRSDYYSTGAERIIKDKRKQSSQGSPFMYAVGCLCSSINKPQGELPFTYITVPGSHRIEKIRVSENQIGVRILEIPANGMSPLVRTYSFKDLVSRELNFVASPPNASSVQKKVIEIMKERGWTTPGIAKDILNIPVEEIMSEMKKLMKKPSFSRGGQNWPGVVYHEAAKKYYFDLRWIQRRLKYVVPNGPWNEDSIVSFACLHAGSIETDYEFFVKEVPDIILRHNATIFVDAGDTKEGNKHHLGEKGELVGGANKTDQEKLAAHLVGTVIFKVFQTRFATLLQKSEQEKQNPEKLREMILEALILFVYILGNHDLWDTEEGTKPLETFHATLIEFLTEHIEQYLRDNNLLSISVFDIVKSKITRKEFFTLPSELNVSVQHPHMARAKTTSLRPQEMLDYGKRFGCQITIGANFHVSETVEEWDMDLGQCVCQEAGTVKHGSNFERHKMKMVDQGIGFLRILSQNKRIFMTESTYYGSSKVAPINNLDILNMFVKKLGIPPIKDVS